MKGAKLKQRLCKHCGETCPEKFEADRKTLCNPCRYKGLTSKAKAPVITPKLSWPFAT